MIKSVRSIKYADAIQYAAYAKPGIEQHAVAMHIAICFNRIPDEVRTEIKNAYNERMRLLELFRHAEKNGDPTNDA